MVEEDAAGRSQQVETRVNYDERLLYVYCALPVVWLGRHIEKPWSNAVPQNDNCWKFGTGPDSIRKLLAAEKRA